MNLVSVYAFHVVPQRHIEEAERTDARGGPARLTSALTDLVEKTVRQKVASSQVTRVDFEFDDQTTRDDHPVRSLLLKIGFGNTRAPRAGALALANRLSESIDNRTGEGLLLITVEVHANKRRLQLFWLPKGSVVEIHDKRGYDDTVEVEIIDGFNPAGGLRKFARFVGTEHRTQFLGGEILDFQLTGRKEYGADFWMKTFLLAKLPMGSEQGTRHLATALMRTYQQAKSDEHDAILGAILKARAVSLGKTSLKAFARKELPESTHRIFFEGISDEHKCAMFEVSKAILKQYLGRYIIRTKDNVTISAPSELVGKRLKLTENGDSRFVEYHGQIVTQEIRRAAAAKPKSAAKTEKVAARTKASA